MHHWEGQCHHLIKECNRFQGEAMHLREESHHRYEDFKHSEKVCKVRCAKLCERVSHLNACEMEIRALFEKMEHLANLHDVEGFLEEVEFHDVIMRTEHYSEYFGEHGSKRDTYKMPVREVRREEHHEGRRGEEVVTVTERVVVRESGGHRGRKEKRY